MIRRAAFSMVEALVAALLSVVVLGAGWMVATSAQRQATQAGRYASVFQAAGSIDARLSTDLASAYIPETFDAVSSTFVVGDDARSLGFLRYQRVDDIEAANPNSPPLVWVQWDTRPGPNGTWIITRTLQEGETTTWQDAPARQVKFELQRYNGFMYAAAEFLLTNAEAAERGTGFAARPVPVRVVRKLRPPSILVPAVLTELPESIVGPLPADTPLIPEEASIEVQVELEPSS